jgi:hypothetical protein
VFVTPYLFAETIILKSGQEIKGKIVKYTADYIIIRSDSKETTIYFKDDIIANIGGTPYGRYGRKLGPVKNTFKSAQGISSIFMGVLIAAAFVLIPLFIIKKIFIRK